MSKLPTVGGKSAAAVLGDETVNALEMDVVKTNYNIERITQEELNHNNTKKAKNEAKNNKLPTNIKTSHLTTNNKHGNAQSNYG